GDSLCGIIDTLARIRLAQGDIAECASLLNGIEDAGNAGDRLLYGHRYSGLTRAQILGRNRDYVGALLQIDNTLADAEESQDLLLARIGLLTKSQLLQEKGSVQEAVRLLEKFPGSGLAGQSPDIYAQYEMILACSLAS